MKESYPCSVEDCSNPCYARDYCRKHYIANLKYGDPLVVKQVQRHGTSLEKRLWSRVDRSGGESACWLWTGNPRGMVWNGERREGAHRIAWTIANGPVPDGLFVLRTCAGGICCNPSHLYLGTNTRGIDTPSRCGLCEKPACQRGWCQMHYNRWKRHGDPLITLNPGLGMTLAERLWSHVDRSGGPDDCWPWTGGALHKFGYGTMGNEKGRPEGSHRIAWKVANGSIPRGMCVRHTCDNPPCCNPAHLVLGTQADNMADVAARGRGTTHLARLNADQARRIRHEASEGVGPNVLAYRFGVSRQTIIRILSGKTWKHV